MTDESSKIIIDEDWKAQVEREREQAAQAAQSEPADEAEAAAEPEAEQPDNAFAGLVTSLSTQALFALGVIAPRDTQEVYVNIEEARYLIDTLMMLRQKTKGNLTAEEEGVLGEALSELQRLYVLRAQQVQEAELKRAGLDLGNLRQPGA